MINRFKNILKTTNGAVFGFITGSIISIILGYFVLVGGDFIEFLKAMRMFAELGLITHFLFCKVKPKEILGIHVKGK